MPASGRSILHYSSIILNNSVHTDVNADFSGVAEMDMKKRDDFEIFSISNILLQPPLK